MPMPIVLFALYQIIETVKLFVCVGIAAHVVFVYECSVCPAELLDLS